MWVLNSANRLLAGPLVPADCRERHDDRGVRPEALEGLTPCSVTLIVRPPRRLWRRARPAVWSLACWAEPIAEPAGSRRLSCGHGGPGPRAAAVGAARGDTAGRRLVRRP